MEKHNGKLCTIEICLNEEKLKKQKHALEPLLRAFQSQVSNKSNSNSFYHLQKQKQKHRLLSFVVAEDDTHMYAHEQIVHSLLEKVLRDSVFYL
jgi:hypothetical protein